MYINPEHPVIGEGYTLLNNNDILNLGDETNCISTLLSPNGNKWIKINKENIGKSITDCLINDADARERIFRRRLKQWN